VWLFAKPRHGSRGHAAAICLISPPGGFEPLRHMTAGKTVILGLISSKTPVIEPLDDLSRRFIVALTR
jgi:hypothetical protein